MSYARVLLVGRALQGDADVLERLRAALQSRGHAVTLMGEADPEGAKAAAFVRTFRPTLVLWDARAGAPSPGTLAVLRAENALSVLVGSEGTDSLGLDGAVPAFVRAGLQGADGEGGSQGPFPLRLPAAPDVAYRAASTSDPDVVRAGIVCTQARTPERERVLDGAGVLSGAFGPFSAFHPSWGGRAQDASCSALAYSARHASLAVLFDGPDAPSPLEAALRLSEGAVVVVEDSLADRWDDRGLADAVARFSGADGLRALLSSASDGRTAQARRPEGCVDGDGEDGSLACRQEAFLDARGPLEDALEGFLDECQSLSRKIGRIEVRPQRVPAKEILLYGWFGMRNFGDDLLLMTAVRRISRHWPESFAIAVGGNAEEVRAAFGLEAYTPDLRYEVRSALRRCSGVAFFGGLMFDDPMQETAGDIEMFMDPWIEPSGQAAMCLEAWMSGVPAVYLGAGAGPLSKPAARNSVRTIGLSGARFVLRDEHSAQLVRGCGVPEGQVCVKTDLVLGGESLFDGKGSARLPEGLSDDGYLVVSLRDWPLVPEGFEREVAACLDEACARFGLRAAFVPFDAADVAIHRRTAERMRAREAAVVLSERPSEDGILRLVSGSRAAVAMRLHCSILHHVLGKPALGLDYNDKIGAHFRSVGQEGMLLPLSADGALMAQALSKALSDYAGSCAAVKKGASDGVRLADEAFGEFFEAVEDSDGPVQEPLCFHPRGRSLARCELECAQRGLAAAQAEAAAQRERAERAERELEEIRTSRSFRLGSAIVGPVARLLGRR